MPVKPTSDHLNQLIEALISAFDHSRLSQFARIHLNFPLESITPVSGKRDLTTITTELVLHFAVQDGGLKSLLSAALQANANNAKLKEVAEVWTDIKFEPLDSSSLDHSHIIKSVHAHDTRRPVSAVGNSNIAIGDAVQDSTVISGNENTVQNIDEFHQSVSNYFEANDKKNLASVAFDSIISRRNAILAILISETLLFLVYLNLQKPFGFNLWEWGGAVWGGIAMLTAISALCLTNVVSKTQSDEPEFSRMNIVGFSGASMVVVALLGQQALPTLMPTDIPGEKFGILLATFDDENDFHISRESRSLTDRIYRGMNELIVGFEDRIVIERIGVIRNPDEAFSAGTQRNADLVVWGIVQQSQSSSTQVKFHVMESLLRSENPNTPNVILPTDPSIFYSIRIEEAEGQTARQVTLGQNQGIANFSFGLFHYLHERNYVEATRAFSTTLGFLEDDSLSYEYQPNFGLIYTYLGKSLQLQGKYVESQKYLNKAIAQIDNVDVKEVRDREKVAALWGKMYNHQALNEQAARYETQQELLHILRTNASSGPAALYNLAATQESIGNFDEAQVKYEELLNRNPEYFIGYFGAARTATELGLYDVTERHLDRMFQLIEGRSEREPWYHVANGNYLASQGFTKEALEELEHSIELLPSMVRSYASIAQLYRKANDIEAAHDMMQLYVEWAERLGHNPAKANLEFCEFLQANNEFEESTRYCKRSIELDVHENRVARAYLGRIYAKLDFDFDIVNKEFESATELLNGNAEVLCTMSKKMGYILTEYGKTLAHYGKSIQAIEKYEKAQACFSSGSGNQSSLGMLIAREYEKLGNCVGAKQIYQTLSNNSQNHFYEQAHKRFVELECG